MGFTTAATLASWTLLADLLVYRTVGYAGPAVFILVVLLFLTLTPLRAKTGSRSSRSILVMQTACILLLILSSLRLVFAGSFSVVFAAIVLTMTLALTTSSVLPSALESVAMFCRAPVDGLRWLSGHRLPSLNKRLGSIEANAPLAVSWLLPIGATVLFGGIFVLANPNLIQLVSQRLDWIATWSWQWIRQISPGELPFCVVACVLAAGLLFPHFGRIRIGGIDVPTTLASGRANYFVAYRNTLVCLIGLFGSYLIFEFATLFRRDFPVGFYYAGYAHQGAAWLTIALALATCLLSFIFRGPVFGDDRFESLQKLSWIWSGTNFLLAVAVYNRLAIYVGYNGMTPMRMVGFFGITVVVVGFCLVLVKISQQRGFWWLIRTQLTALMFGLIGLALCPIDYLSHSYNARAINHGYLPPSVMIAVKEKDDSGYLPMLHLIDCDDEIIREGVRAMLARKQRLIESENEKMPWHWTRYQIATRSLYERLIEQSEKLKVYREDIRARNRRIEVFREYSMQWY